MVEWLERVESGIITFEHGDFIAAFYEEKRDVAEEWADLQDTFSSEARQAEMAGGAPEACLVLQKISMGSLLNTCFGGKLVSEREKLALSH